MSPLRQVDPVTQDVREQLHKRREPSANTGPAVVSEHRSASDATLIHLSRLCIRWLMHTDQRKPEHLRIGPERMAVTWPSVLRALSRVIAIERMTANEPDEIAKYKQMQADHQAKLKANARESASFRESLKRRQDHHNDVFLARFFPIPKSGEWHPAFWGDEDLRTICKRLATSVAGIPRAEPAWYPDGWEESVSALGGVR